MSQKLRSTFSNQRFSLKDQISIGLVASDGLPSTAHFDGSLEQSFAMLKEPLNNNNRLSRVLSSISSILLISPWHEGSSTGVSTLTTTLVSHRSHNTSRTSFDLNDSPKSLDEGRCNDAPEVEERLTQSSMKAEQIDPHVPPSPTPLKSRFSDYSDLMDDDDVSVGEICFVSSSRTAEANTILTSMATMHSVTESMPWYQTFCDVHPEYDSDLDRDTETTGSFLTLPLTSAEDDAESEAGHKTSASDNPIPGADPVHHSILSEMISTPPSSSPLPKPSPCYMRPCIFSARDAPLSDKETRTSHEHDPGTHRQRSSRAKSGLRKFLSIILPCIPALTTKRLDEEKVVRKKSSTKLYW